jgi:diketogulonate reductase-like aldo/keto reductase
MNINSKIVLNNNTEIPVIGLGVWKTPSGKGTEDAVIWALEAGYRHIDTAKIYMNEKEVGNAIGQSGIKREELFITTKLWNDDQGYINGLRAFDESLKRLQMDYVDLYLIHWPFIGWGDSKVDTIINRKESWKALEEIYSSRRAKAIGVCNFQIEHLEEMKTYASIAPMVNQIEFHPFWFRKELMEYCHKNSIAVTDYCPLVRGKKLFDTRITAIANNYNKTNAQILIRWGLQHGNIIIPKSSHKERIEENIDVFDFEISIQDMEKLDALNENFNVVFA